MNKLFIMQGIPGSGKSTIARKLQEESPTTQIGRASCRERV